MQEQQVRQSCHAIAGQLFLLDPVQHGRQDGHNTSSSIGSSGVPIARSGGLSNPTPSNPGLVNENTSSAVTAASSSGPDKKNSRTDDLRRVCEAIVRDAMTLYRLCHRPGGGGVAIVLGPSSSSGGGGGAAVEEAAYCVCAAIMAREESLWSSLVWRAQLLRPRKPTLCFAPPVMMPPVVVKDVVKFFGRSRHLVKSASGVTVAAAAPPSTLASAESPTATAPPPPAFAPPATTAAALNGGNATAALTPQQAEAVAAAFFFKTMSAAERQRRPEILAIRVAASPSSPSGGKVNVVSCLDKRTGVAPRIVGSSAGASTVSLPLQRTGGTGHGSSSAPSPSPIAAALAALKGRGVPGLSSGNDQAARQPVRRSLHLPRTSSSLLLMDDWSGWGGGDALRQRGTVKDAVTTTGEASRGWSRSSSSSSNGSSSGDSSISRRSVGSEGHHVKGLSSGSGQDRSRVAGQGHAADAGGRRRDRHAKAAAAAEAAALERLYRLAIDADTTLASEEEETERDRGDTALEVGSGGGDGGVSSSMFTGGKGLGLVSLAAMTTQVQDTLHWGRMTALVRFPLLFRGLAAPALVPPSVTAAVQLTSTSEALTAASMASMSNALGASYTSTWMPTAAPPFLTGASSQSAEGLQADVEAFVSTYGAPGSFLCPARLRTSSSSLLPPPPSLVTDGFLWTRLLVCSAWLVVYADSLLDEGDVSEEEAEEDEERSALVRPRVQPNAAVQEVVAYCVSVLREARAVSAGMTGEKDAAAFSSSPYHVSGGGNNGGVCCPVCDRLVKEQLPVLWWSTLREDRTQLRAQVQALLENGSANDAEAQVAVQVAVDGVREGRGGRQYAAPLLRGSGAAGQQVAALQKHWGMYIMGVADPVEKGEATGIEDGNHGTARETTETLWAALTQRVAATADLCAFVSSHRMQETRLSSAKSRAAAASGAAAGSSRHARGHRTRAAIGGHEGRGRRTRKRRRRSDSFEETDEEEEEEGEVGRHSSGSESDSGDVDQRARRRADSTSSGEGAAPLADAGEATAAFHGSRHAHEVAEEWERLLRRCGWVTAAPPRASASASARSAADVAVYTRWAASLGLSAAGPSPQQAITLRHRLSEYCLSDVTRTLVLGRGGRRERYSALLFGAEAVVPSSADRSPAAPRDFLRGQADRQQEIGTSEPALLPPSSAATHRAASMSLLEESTRELLSLSAHVSEADEEEEEAEGKAVKCLTTPSTSPPALTSPNSFAPLSPPSPSSALAITPSRRSALLSIPLHVSPRARPALPEAKAEPPLPNDTREAVDAGIGGGRGASAFLCASSTHRPAPSTSPQLPAETSKSKHPAATGCVAARSQLLAQRDALYALLDFHPRFPPLREEDAVVECGSCFALFHQDCVAPVQRDLLGQVFLCHACRLRWARPYVGVEKAGGGLFHQAQALSQLQGCIDEGKSFS